MGQFTIEDAPPGEFSCTLYNHKGIPGHSVRVNIQPGTTTHVEIGGNGRTLTGRLKSASTNAVNWPQPIVARLEAQVPALPNFGPADDVATLRRKAEFWLSPEGFRHSHANRMYPFDILSDGSFSLHDVPARAYRLVAVYSNASVHTDVIVAEGSEAFDLGELIVR